jgi:hypothetical protein
MGVEDLYSATNFLNDNAKELGIDPSALVIAGSSAGAIIAMQAEYEICNGTSWTKVLPKGFRYAGVMSFSGAILSREGKVDYKVYSPAPTLMLHGTSDELVPYSQIAFFNLGFFNPQMTDQALACLNMMDFNGKDEVMQKIRENGTLQEMLLMYQRMALQFANQIDPALGEQVAQQILGQGGQPIPHNMIAESQAMGDVNNDGSTEHPFVEKARSDARATTQAD